MHKLTDVVIVLIFAAGSLLLGLAQMLLVQIPVMILASIIGVWLFSIQHRYGAGNRNGIPPLRRWIVRPSCACRGYCSGLRATSDFTISTTSIRGCRTTG